VEVPQQGIDKRQRLKRHLQTLSQATHPCAFTYSYARIRRLVRLGGGFYCGSVADESAIGFRSPDQSRRTALLIVAFLAMVLHGGCARDTFGYAGFLDSRSANLRTAATSLRFAANCGGSINQGASP